MTMLPCEHCVQPWAHALDERCPCPPRRSAMGPAAGPLQPRLQACMMFYRWEGTHNTNFLNQAVADARSPRIPWQSKLRFRTDLSGLRNSTREANYAHSSTTINYEHAIQDDCNQATAGLNSRDRAKARRAFVRLSRPSTTTGR